MSTIIADNLTGKTSAGSVTVTSEGGAATFQMQQGLVKTWVNLNMTSFATNDSFGISSTSDVGTGEWGPSFTNNYANIRYCSAGSSIGSTDSWATTMYVSNGNGNDATTTSGYRAVTRDAYPTNSGIVRDMNNSTVLNIGDLA